MNRWDIAVSVVQCPDRTRSRTSALQKAISIFGSSDDANSKIQFALSVHSIVILDLPLIPFLAPSSMKKIRAPARRPARILSGVAPAVALIIALTRCAFSKKAPQYLRVPATNADIANQ